METENQEIELKKGEIFNGLLRVPKAPGGGVWGHELKYEVSCIFRHVPTKENERIPQQI